MLLGWRKMNRALYCNVVLCTLCCAPLKAQHKVDELPSIPFLEYLADMQEVDGKLYGPQDMSVEPCQRSVSEREEQNNENSNEVNGAQNDKAQKNEKTATEQECKHHD